MQFLDRPLVVCRSILLRPVSSHYLKRDLNLFCLILLLVEALKGNAILSTDNNFIKQEEAPTFHSFLCYVN